MQSRANAADRHSYCNCDTERPESVTRARQENPTDSMVFALWFVWNVFYIYNEPGNGISGLISKLLSGLYLPLAVYWAISSIVAWCIRTDGHSLIHQPKIVGKALMHNLTVHMAQVWSSYKGHHRLRHFLPEACTVLKLVCLVLPSTYTLVLHVLPLLRIAVAFAIFVPQGFYSLRSGVLLCGTKGMPSALLSICFLFYLFLYLYDLRTTLYYYLLTHESLIVVITMDCLATELIWVCPLSSASSWPHAHERRSCAMHAASVWRPVLS